MTTAAELPDLDASTLEVAPLARSETIPSSWYTAAAFHRFDREALFATTWQYAGHESELPGPGDYRTATVGGQPLFVVRGHDGRARAFFNVCRHRGGPLLTDERGTVRKVLQCKYHGWCYLLDGTLRGVPRFDRTELFDKADFGLVPVELDSWHGLLFVRITSGPATLAEVMDGIAERIAPLDPRPMRFARRAVYEVACNWKVYVDNYLEGYHIPLVHPELARVLDYRAYRTETFTWHSLQHSPLAGADSPYGTGDGEAFYYFVFPNFMLNVLPGRLQTNVVEPLAADRCRVVFDYYYDAPEAAGREAQIAADLEFSDRVQHEDIEICEHVQRGLESRAYDRGRFSVECENGVHHFQGLLKAAYRAALEPR